MMPAWELRPAPIVGLTIEVEMARQASRGPVGPKWDENVEESVVKNSTWTSGLVGA